MWASLLPNRAELLAVRSSAGRVSPASSGRDSQRVFGLASGTTQSRRLFSSILDLNIIVVVFIRFDLTSAHALVGEKKGGNSRGLGSLGATKVKWWARWLGSLGASGG